MVSAVTLLPQPDSPTTPSVWPRLIENETPSTALTRPSMTWKYVRRSRTSRSTFGPLEARAVLSMTGAASVTYSRLRGSSASRRPSPMKLMAMTVRAMAMPGKKAHHQLPRMSAV